MAKAKHRRVDWTSDEDLRCAILGAMGFSTKFIGEQTGLSPCQITYRLHKESIKRADYRNGESDMAQRIIDRMTPDKRTIRKTLSLEQCT